MRSPKKQQNMRKSHNNTETSESRVNQSTDNIRKVTIELQNVYTDLTEVAEAVSHSRELYSEIMNANDRYGELIGSLVNEIKFASAAKLQVCTVDILVCCLYMYVYLSK